MNSSDCPNPMCRHGAHEHCRNPVHWRDRMEPFRPYRRKQIAELRPYIPGEALSDRISISAADKEAGSPEGEAAYRAWAPLPQESQG